jgi:hypothetical protein
MSTPVKSHRRMLGISVALVTAASVFGMTSAPALAAGPPEEPTTLSPAASITGTSAIFEGVLNPHKKATVGGVFAYSDPEGLTCLEGPQAALEGFEGEQEVQAQTVHAKVPLEPKRTYKFCLVATNEGGVGVTPGKEVTVTTPAIVPTVETESTAAVTDDGATPAEARLEASVNANNEEVTKCEFQYGTEATLATSTSAPCEQATLAGVYGPQPADVNLSGLAAKTKYYYRVVATNATGASKGTAIESFTTPLHPETPEKLDANPIAANTATLNAVLNPAAPGDPGTYEFHYRKSATECEGGEPGEEKITPATKSLGGKQEAAKASIAELLPHTIYTFCMLAKNEAGEESALSAPETFTTLVAAPTVEQFTTEVASTSATLNAKLNPQGAETTYTFELAPSGGSFAPVAEPGGKGTLPEGTTAVPVSVHVQQGLSADTSYEFRLVAHNSVKEVTGEPPVSFTTQRAGGEFQLPDARQYEMVTPPQKQGALFRGLSPFDVQSESLVQVSVAGNSIVDLADSPSEAEPQGYANQVSVLSTRSSAGWSSQVISPPHDQGTGPGRGGSEYELFSEDLSAGLLRPFGQFSPYSPEATESTPYLHTDYLNGNVDEHCQSSCFRPLVTSADDTASPFVPFGGSASGEGVPGVCNYTICGPSFAGASPDLSHVVIESQAVPLTAAAGTGLYEWSAGRLQLVSIPPAGESGLGKLYLAGTRNSSRESEHYGARRAISEDGGRVLFDARGGTGKPADLYLRNVASSETVRLDVAQPPATGVSVGLEYMTASSDASRVFFLDEGHLTARSSASGEDLYEYDLEKPVGERLTDLTVDRNTLAGGEGEAAGVAAVLGASDDGSYVYFAAGGALAPGAVPAAPSEYGVPGEYSTCAERPRDSSKGCNIYVLHDGQTRLVAAGWIDKIDGVLPSDWSRVSSDGRWLAFMSSQSLTGYDIRDAVSGQPDAEVYLYHAEPSASGELEQGKLVCASCDPTGARPTGKLVEGSGVAANVPGWQIMEGGQVSDETRHQSRYLSDNGRLFFESSDALVPQDVNGVGDVYEYEPEGVPAGPHACSSASTTGSDVFKPARAFTVGGVGGEEGAGCVALISSGTSSEASTFLDASETGGDVFFLTTSKLAPQDSDALLDVYDAHECTGESPCIPPAAAQPPACTTEAACKAPPTPQPSIYGLPASATFSGPGNLAPPAATVPKKVTKKTVKCKRGFVKNKQDRCVKTPKKKKNKAKKSAHINRRAPR